MGWLGGLVSPPPWRTSTKDIATMTITDSIKLDYLGTTLRVAIKDGKPWFVAADLCRILAVHMRYGKPLPGEAVRTLRPDQKVLHPMETSCGPRLVVMVPESGVYALACRAVEAVSREFGDWMVDHALPTIRRTYAAGLRVPVTVS